MVQNPKGWNKFILAYSPAFYKTEKRETFVTAINYSANPLSIQYKFPKKRLYSFCLLIVVYSKRQCYIGKVDDFYAMLNKEQYY